MKRNPNGFILWEDEKIVWVITGFNRWSENPKTGPMLQTYGMVKEMHPPAAMARGLDTLICGDCPMKGENGIGRMCYVNKATAPYNIWQYWKADTYPPLTDLSLLRGRTLRLGSEGDPTTVPIDRWMELIGKCDGHTGYTHQWRKHSEFKPIIMASCDSVADQTEASAQGWRTFRIKREEYPVMKDEVVCPASEEAGHKTTCRSCQLCSGTRTKAKNVVINAHGRMRKHFR